MTFFLLNGFSQFLFSGKGNFKGFEFYPWGPHGHIRQVPHLPMRPTWTDIKRVKILYSLFPFCETNIVKLEVRNNAKFHD